MYKRWRGEVLAGLGAVSMNTIMFITDVCLGISAEFITYQLVIAAISGILGLVAVSVYAITAFKRMPRSISELLKVMLIKSTIILLFMGPYWIAPIIWPSMYCRLCARGIFLGMQLSIASNKNLEEIIIWAEDIAAGVNEIDPASYPSALKSHKYVHVDVEERGDKIAIVIYVMRPFRHPWPQPGFGVVVGDNVVRYDPVEQRSVIREITPKVSLFLICN